MPRSRNTRIRPKDTSRAEARRRYRDEHRPDLGDPDAADESDETVEPVAATAPSRPAFAMPNVGEDLRALPQVFRKRLVWAPFGLLLLAFVLELARQGGMFPQGEIIGCAESNGIQLGCVRGTNSVEDIALLYVQLTLPPTSLFVFFIGGFVAERASYLVGAILGVFDAALITILVLFTPDQTLPGSGITEVAEGLLPLWGIAILVGIFSAAFAAWYKRFLRSSQERARINRAAREREQAAKAKEQARADRQAARDARRTRP